jgi:hypothetical protein
VGRCNGHNFLDNGIFVQDHQFPRLGVRLFVGDGLPALPYNAFLLFPRNIPVIPQAFDQAEESG